MCSCCRSSYSGYPQGPQSSMRVGTVSLKDDVPHLVDLAQLVALAAQSQATTHTPTSG